MNATTKSSATDLVTVHDRAAEEAIVAGLGAARPDDAIVGEEGTDRAGTSGISWLVDPIDGTTNFVYDLPLWSTSIAAADGDGMLVGAVYAPVLGELFAAGAWPGRDAGRATDPLQRPHRPRAGPRRHRVQLPAGAPAAAGRAVAERLIGSVRDVRRLGSAALDLCYVAAGRYDAYYETGLNSWDAAAGELIATEAGCRSGDFAGGPPGRRSSSSPTPAIFDAWSPCSAASRRGRA